MRVSAILVFFVAMFTAPAIHASHATASALPARPAKPVRSASRTIVVTSSDFAYTGLPAHAPAGWLTFRMVNSGHEFHMFASAVVQNGSTASTMLDSILHSRVPKNFKEWGGPNAVAPGDTTSVTLYFPAGDYVVGCFVVSPDGKTHFMKGMMGSFHVDAASDTGSAPSSDRRVTLSTYGIGMTDAPLARGTRTFMVTNSAKETHDFVILKVLPGHSVTDALAWFRNPPTGGIAARAVGGTTGIHTGEVAYVTANLSPGTYVLVCWMSTNSKYHYDMGMKKAFTVPAA